ncbi:MAG: SDR family oxidoreductase [Alphaproteobacteria bacterium]|nr:SDR family oxidoreductase [Alphaproteobacteria bacterium]MBU0797929.1 SDR family oxidoreductase [Alphaproteobacteria bacterium]MBU0886119.1 SDR family oxidoreductase [Alphaproteobacteria bacterium]MBU1812759.1 SDR family oxidoreductase [Alphaproteobacteria bacterium]MBU2091125.1 SDR family oxidoreductase [Alphaproteobacteria bacterium]
MKSVLITGGGRGIGLAITRRLQADGYAPIVVSRSLTPEIEALGVPFIAHDLADIDGLHKLATGIVQKHGPLYGLVNNAGIGLDGVLATQHLSDIERVLRVNLLASIALTKSVCRGMMSRGEGRIITLSSIIARTGFSGLSVYAASKAGLEGFSQSLARELGPTGITVNCVAPGFIETDMTGGLQGDKLAAIRRRSPLGDLASATDVAGAVAYLLGPDAARVTGTVLTVDAGSTA